MRWPKYLGAYIRAQYDKPLQRVFSVLDILTLLAFLLAPALATCSLVLSAHTDVIRAAALLLFVALFLSANYTIFAELRTKVDELEHALEDTQPILVVQSLTTPPKTDHWLLEIANEGHRPAINIHVRANYKEWNLNAAVVSLAPQEHASVSLCASPVGDWPSRARVNRALTKDETIVVLCEYDDPAGDAYVARCEGQFGSEWVYRGTKRVG